MNGGETLFFDSKGDSPARYELVNLQKVTKGTMEVVTIGYYDATQPRGQQFTMNNVNIIWGGGLRTVRVSFQMNSPIKTKSPSAHVMQRCIITAQTNMCKHVQTCHTAYYFSIVVQVDFPWCVAGACVCVQ